MPRTTGFALLLAASALILGHGIARAGDASPEDLCEKLDNALRTNGKAYLTLAKWCARNEMPGVAARFQARALRLRPDDKTLRKTLGYERKGKTWIANEAKRLPFRDAAFAPGVREDDPALVKKRASTERLMVRRLRSIALAAVAPDDADAAALEAYDAVREDAWTALLELDSKDGEARDALGHATFGDERVHPDAVPFLTARRLRRMAATDAWGKDVAIEARVVQGKMPQSWSPLISIDNSYGIENARTLALGCTRALHLFAAEFDLTLVELEELELKTIVVVGSRRQFARIVRESSNWGAEKVERMISRFGALFPRPSKAVIWSIDDDQALESAINFCIRYALFLVRDAQRKDLPEAQWGNADWLYEAVAMDMVIRLTGTYGTNISSDRTTSDDRKLDAAPDWLATARLLVELDDDPPITAIAQRELNSLGTRETAKAYAFLQYLHERLGTRTREFVRSGLSRGTHFAAKLAFGETLAELDAGYRRWIWITR